MKSRKIFLGTSIHFFALFGICLNGYYYIILPVWKWRACLLSTVGSDSQCSYSWEGSSTKSRSTEVPAQVINI